MDAHDDKWLRTADRLAVRLDVPYSVATAVVMSEAARQEHRRPAWLRARLVKHTAIQRLRGLHQEAAVEHDLPGVGQPEDAAGVVARERWLG